MITFKPSVDVMSLLLLIDELHDTLTLIEQGQATLQYIAPISEKLDSWGAENITPIPSPGSSHVQDRSKTPLLML